MFLLCWRRWHSIIPSLIRMRACSRNKLGEEGTIALSGSLRLLTQLTALDLRSALPMLAGPAFRAEILLVDLGACQMKK